MENKTSSLHKRIHGLHIFVERNNSYIYISCECEHCGGKKYLKLPYTVPPDYHYWSDGMIEGNPYSYASYVQKCPHCGSFFLVDFNSCPEVYNPPSVEDCMDVSELAALLSDKELAASIQPDYHDSLMLHYVHRYNDMYRRGLRNQGDAPYEQSRVFVNAILHLTGRRCLPMLILADLYRQAGMFYKCLEYAADMVNRIENKRDYEILDEIRYRAIKGDSAPFVTRHEYYSRDMY